MNTEAPNLYRYSPSLFFLHPLKRTGRFLMSYQSWKEIQEDETCFKHFNDEKESLGFHIHDIPSMKHILITLY